MDYLYSYIMLLQLIKLTPFGILNPLMIVSLVIQRPFPITTGYIL